MAKYSVTVKLDKMREVRYDPMALSKAEQILDMGLAEMLSPKRIGVRTLLTLLYVGLERMDNKITMEDANDIMMNAQKELKLGGLADVLIRAIKEAGWNLGGSDEEELLVDAEKKDKKKK